MNNLEIYRSILNRLSSIPVQYLKEVDDYLKSLKKKMASKKKNREAILQFAGAWSEMDDNEFEDLLMNIRETGEQLFNRETNL